MAFEQYERDEHGFIIIPEGAPNWYDLYQENQRVLREALANKANTSGSYKGLNAGMWGGGVVYYSREDLGIPALASITQMVEAVIGVPRNNVTLVLTVNSLNLTNYPFGNVLSPVGSGTIFIRKIDGVRIVVEFIDSQNRSMLLGEGDYAYGEGIYTWDGWSTVQIDDNTGWVSIPGLNGAVSGAGARRIGNIIYFRGAFSGLNNIADGTIIGSLPYGYRPSGSGATFSLPENTAAGVRMSMVSFTADGDIRLFLREPTASSVIVDAVSYPVSYLQ